MRWAFSLVMSLLFTKSAFAQVPSGAIMFFDAPSCPSGWHAFAAARGRVLVGLPDGGTLGATVGDPLSDQENRGHTHGVNPAPVNTSTGGSHSHSVSVSGNTGSAGSHNHQWSRVVNRDWYSYESGGSQVLVGAWDDGIGNDGSGHYPLFTSGSGELRYYTNNAGGHSHSINASGTSASSGSHNHSVDVANTVSSTASTAQVIPYIQLLVCRKD